jgi:hypothetical protein
MAENTLAKLRAKNRSSVSQTRTTTTGGAAGGTTVRITTKTTSESS